MKVKYGYIDRPSTNPKFKGFDERFPLYFEDRDIFEYKGLLYDCLLNFLYENSTILSYNEIWELVKTKEYNNLILAYYMIKEL